MNKNLDQFYTNPKICDKLVTKIFNLLPSTKNFNFIEPSAGTGNFIHALKKQNIRSNKIKSYDIDPKSEDIIKSDYLKTKINYNKKNFIIGNPPFGKRAKLAIEFLNKGLNEADYVAMILPKTFNRFSVQKQIKKNAKLIYSETLEREAFLVDNKAYNVNCVFQIWVNENIILATKDKRLKSNLTNKDNQDFELFIHNNTDQTKKYFNKKIYKWDFAVVRQGYYDYNKKITKENELIPNRQYLFVKCNNEIAKKIIDLVDFEKLAKTTSTTVYGFSNSDLIKEYNKFKFLIYLLNENDIESLKNLWIID
ncbi:hypothetical protein ACW95P_04390 [Candidatus Mycoplasma pogonae]